MTALLDALQEHIQTLPANPGWQKCLQDVYTAFQPSAADFARAIYTTWTATALAPASRVSFVQLASGLDAVTNAAGKPAYGMAAIGPVVNAFYMEVTIFVDTFSLRGDTGASAPEPANTGDLICMVDNHPGDDCDHGGACALDDERLVGNMTIHWRAVSSSAATDPVALTAFRVRSGNWNDLASTPVRLADGSWVAYANPVPKPDTSVTYAFDFTLDERPVTFWFDPFIGTHDGDKHPSAATAWRGPAAGRASARRV